MLRRDNALKKLSTVNNITNDNINKFRLILIYKQDISCALADTGGQVDSNPKVGFPIPFYLDTTIKTKNDF